MMWWQQVSTEAQWQQFVAQMNTPPASAVAQLLASTDEASAFEAVLEAKQGRR